MSAKKARHQGRVVRKKCADIALCGILLALSAGISAAESLIPLPLGVKPGFSNLPVMYSMYRQGAKYGLAICIMKSVFVLMTRGFTAFVMSITGGVLSYLAMLFLYKKLGTPLMLMSVTGALIHNFGQLCAASLMMHTAVFSYAPVMIVSGAIAGTATGILIKLLFNAAGKIEQGGNQ